MKYAALIILFIFVIILKGDNSNSNFTPTDEFKLNKFGREYNKYIELLNQNIVDTRQWKKVKKEWLTIVNE